MKDLVLAHSAADVRGVTWHRARACSGASCVEVAFLGERGVAVRDSANPTGPALAFDAAEWTSFVAGVHAGEFTPGA